jgi:hypothetical protein
VRWSPTPTCDAPPGRTIRDPPRIAGAAAGGRARRGRPQELFFAPIMTRRLARKNIFTGLIVAGVCMFMFAVTFLVAAVYIS